MPKKRAPKPTPEVEPVVDSEQKLETEQEQLPKPEPVTKVTVASEIPKPMVVKTPAKTPTKRFPMWAWYSIAGVVVLGAAGFLGWKLFGSTTTTNANSNTTVVVNTNTVPLVARALDGVPVPEAQANTPVEAVMIENMVDSRPPSGLDKASVVYETLAEGGITRFMALFPSGSSSIKEIGPVRSSRIYYVQYAEEYHALYAHAGGSPEALTYLQSSKTNVVDFNQFSHGGNFIRDDNRAAPHNLYTNSDLLYIGLRRTTLRDYVPTYTPWTFKAEPALDARVQSANDIVINFSSNTYKVTYKYDRVQNQYMRYVADQPHITRDGSQIYAKDIAVLYTTMVTTQNNHGRMDITTIGTGKMQLFRDGTATDGTWKKESASGRTQFLDASGNALALDPGQIWIEVVPTTAKVTY